MSDVNKDSIVNERMAEYQMTEEEGESSVASVEEQLKKEMTVYEVWLKMKYWINTFTFCLCSPFKHWDAVRTAEIHRRNANKFWEYVAGQDT